MAHSSGHSSFEWAFFRQVRILVWFYNKQMVGQSRCAGARLLEQHHHSHGNPINKFDPATTPMESSLGYLQSDQLLLTMPSGDKQLHDQRGRISRIPAGPAWCYGSGVRHRRMRRQQRIYALGARPGLEFLLGLCTIQPGHAG